MRQRLAGYAIAAALLLPGAPAAAYSEAEFCTALTRLLDAAVTQFRGVKSTTASFYIDGVPHFLALQTLPDTRQCVITVGDNPLLSCEYYTGILPRAEAVYARLTGEVRRCLRKHIRGPVLPAEEKANLIEYQTDDRVAVIIDNGDLFGEVVNLRLHAMDKE
jgi:hypothetical protein